MTILTPVLERGSLLENFFDDLKTNPEVHTPDVQIKKNEKEYKIQVKVAGAKKEDIQVEIESGYLKISGKYETQEEEDYKNLHSEFKSYTEFLRHFPIDLGRFEVEQINAQFDNGLLEISLPLKENEKPKQITIQ